MFIHPNVPAMQDDVETDFRALGGHELWSLVDEESRQFFLNQVEINVNTRVCTGRTSEITLIVFCCGQDKKAQRARKPEDVEVKSTWMEEGEKFEGICQVDTRKGPPVTCLACDNMNGESIMINLQSCDCTDRKSVV